MNTTVILIIAGFLILFSLALCVTSWCIYDNDKEKHGSLILLNSILSVICLMCILFSISVIFDVNEYESKLDKIEKSTPKITDVPERANFDTLLTIHNGDTIVTSYPIVWNDDVDINNNKN